jgi:hypothetical protein
MKNLIFTSIFVMFIVGCVMICLLNSIASVHAGFISQTNIFSGEVASNLTDGAPLVVSSTGKITTGLTSGEAVLASSTVTSATDVALSGVTLTPVAGTYFAMFSTYLTHSTGNATITMSLYVGGVQNANSVRVAMPFVGAISAVTQDMPLATSSIVTVNGSQTIAVEWHTSTSTGTEKNAVLDIIRLQ